MTDWLLSTQRFVIAAAIVLTGCLFLPALADPVNVVKLTVLVIAALTLLLLSALRVIRSRILAVPRSVATYAAVALALAFLLSALVAPNTTMAVVGTYGRNSGLMAYAAALVLFFVGVRAWTAATSHVLALGLLASGLFTAMYGLLQYAGIDAIRWANPYNPIIASLGNPDFASAYLGMCVPAAAWGALWQRWPLPWRVLSGLVALACLAAAVLSQAVQGPLAAAAGLGVLAAALLLERGGSFARRGLLVLGGLTAFVLVILVAGAVKLGPAAPIFRRSSFRARQFYWDAALSMFRQHPLVGVGLDHYGAHWRQVRSDAATRVLGGSGFSDAAHSVPLQILAQGGLVLGLCYLFFVVAVAVCLVRGLRRLAGPPRLLLGAVGGSWAAYVVSAAVSIDQVPLLTVEFVTAGAVVGLAGVRWQEVRLPGALAVGRETARQRRRAPVVRERAFAGIDAAWAAGAGVLLLALLWFSLVPFRASAAAHRADVALSRGDVEAAHSALVSANQLLPAEGIYAAKLGSFYESEKQTQQALSVYRAGARRARFDPALLLNEGRLAQAAGDVAEARTAYQAAIRLNPTNPATVEAAAAFLVDQGASPAAEDALRRAARANPDDASLQAALGVASEKAGDAVSARAAYQRALELQPGMSEAQQGLARLPAGTP